MRIWRRRSISKGAGGVIGRKYLLFLVYFISELFLHKHKHDQDSRSLKSVILAKEIDEAAKLCVSRLCASKFKYIRGIQPHFSNQSNR